MKCVVTDMPRHEALRTTAAQWSFSEWGKLYPDDSVQWYLDLYAELKYIRKGTVVISSMNLDDS